MEICIQIQLSRVSVCIDLHIDILSAMNTQDETRTNLKVSFGFIYIFA